MCAYQDTNTVDTHRYSQGFPRVVPLLIGVHIPRSLFVLPNAIEKQRVDASEKGKGHQLQRQTYQEEL